MRRTLAALVLVLGAITLVAAPAGAVDLVEVDATIGGRAVDTAGSGDPIRIDPRREIPIVLDVRNIGTEVEEVRFVRLEGTALGLTFLTYDLGVRTTLEPGQTATIDTTLDFFDLDRQATGYLGTSLRVYGEDRRLLGEQDFVIDVRGSATSTLGMFAVVVLAIAVFSVTVLVLNTFKRKLPSNRFVRGTQFALAGGAIGITLALGVSILRITFAEVEAWVPLVVLPTLIAFVVGYLAPGPLSESIRDVREEEALQYAADDAVARASGAHAPASAGRVPSDESGEWPADADRGADVT